MPLKSRLSQLFFSPFAELSGSVWLLCGVCFINFLGTMVITFMSLHMKKHLGFSVGFIGQLMALYGVGGILGGYVSGRLCDRFDSRKILALFLGVQGLGLTLLAFAETPAVLGLLICFTSFFESGFRPAFNVSLSRVCPASLRQNAFSLYMLLINMAIAVASAIGGYLFDFGFRYVCWFDGLSCIAAAGFLVVVYERIRVTVPVPASSTPSLAPPPFRNPLFIGFCGLVLLISFVYFQARVLSPLYLNTWKGVTPKMFGLLSTLQAGSYFLLQMWLVQWSRRLNPFTVAGLGGFLLCAGYGLFPIADAFPIQVFAFLLSAVGQMVTFPTLMAMVSHRFGEGRTGEYLGIYQMVFSSSLVTAPLVGTFLYEALTPNLYWLFILCVGCLLPLGYRALSQAMAAPAVPKNVPRF